MSYEDLWDSCVPEEDDEAEDARIESEERHERRAWEILMEDGEDPDSPSDDE